MYNKVINHSDDEDINSSTILLATKQSKQVNQTTTPDPNETKKEEIEQIAHKVQYGDTLQGLSLQYSVPISKIKYRNHLDSDNIYHLKHIIIPNPMNIPPTKDKTQALMVQEFNSYMDYSEKDRKIAKYYLTENNWNMQAARKQYKEDLEWQKKNPKTVKTAGQNIKSRMETQMKTMYGHSDLKTKKMN